MAKIIENVNDTAGINDANQSIASEHVNDVIGQIESAPLSAFQMWDNNPRPAEDMEQDAILARFRGMFDIVDGRNVWSDKHPAEVVVCDVKTDAIVPDNVTYDPDKHYLRMIQGNCRLSYMLDMLDTPSDTSPLTIPYIRIVGKTESELYIRAVDTSDGSKPKPRYAVEAAILLHLATKPGETYSGWLARAWRLMPHALAILAPAVLRCSTIKQLVDATYGHLGRYWRFAKNAPAAARAEYITGQSVSRKERDEKAIMLTSIREIDQALADMARSNVPVTHDGLRTACAPKEKPATVTPGKMLGDWMVKPCIINPDGTAGQEIDAAKLLPFARLMTAIRDGKPIAGTTWPQLVMEAAGIIAAPVVPVVPVVTEEAIAKADASYKATTATLMADVSAEEPKKKNGKK